METILYYIEYYNILYYIQNHTILYYPDMTLDNAWKQLGVQGTNLCPTLKSWGGAGQRSSRIFECSGQCMLGSIHAVSYRLLSVLDSILLSLAWRTPYWWHGTISTSCTKNSFLCLLIVQKTQGLAGTCGAGSLGIGWKLGKTDTGLQIILPCFVGKISAQLHPTSCLT